MTDQAGCDCSICDRDRIAEVIYGDGNELAWARCVELADLVMWEIRR